MCGLIAATAEVVIARCTQAVHFVSKDIHRTSQLAHEILIQADYGIQSNYIIVTCDIYNLQLYREEFVMCVCDSCNDRHSVGDFPATAHKSYVIFVSEYNALHTNSEVDF